MCFTVQFPKLAQNLCKIPFSEVEEQGGNLPLIPFSKRYSENFLSRTEDNFDILLDKIKIFYKKTRNDIKDGKISRRNLNNKFNYKEELKEVKINQKSISSEKVASEFNDMLKGCIRHQDPTAAFNIIPTPLFDTVAGITLASLYNANPCWDFISGKLCLYEKKIVRMLGGLVDWPKADGFVITGGKQAIAYAIKNGMGRANGNNPGKNNEYVVICSSAAHYCIEHVGSYLGIHSENCLRISSKTTGEIDLDDFKNKLEKSIQEGKKIAAVIAVAGATINLMPDPVRQMKNIIDEIAKKYDLEYLPHLHVDSVITWAWLSFKNDVSYLAKTNSVIARKINSVLSKIVDIKYADSFAADFHKTGFCPYAAGVFVTKDATNLVGMTSRGYVPLENPYFGEVEPLRLTIENSRSALPIVAIWIAIRRMGLEGLRQYIIYQMEVCELFKQKIKEKYDAHFEVLNEQFYGWEIVLKPHFYDQISWDSLQNASEEMQEDYIRDCYSLVNDYWYSPLEEENSFYPVIGFVPKYSRRGAQEKSFPALLIHPTSLHYDEEAVDEMLDKIFRVKNNFILRGEKSVFNEEKEYLHAVTPPR